jgi:hypothetical protein
MVDIVLILLGIFLIMLSVVSVELVRVNYRNSLKKSEEIEYIFPKELFDANFPDSILLEKDREDFEKRRQQAFNLELP